MKSKKIFKVIILLCVMAYLIFAVTQLTHPTEEQLCQEVSISVGDSTEGSFLKDCYVYSSLTKNKISPEGQKVCQINLAQIEQCLKENPYIDNASCHYSTSGILCVHVHPRKPILHVMAQNGEEYYMDENGNTMPVGNFNLNLCVATGQIKKDYAKTDLVQLAKFIYNNNFWNQQIVQIHVATPHNVILSPRVGDQDICLGEIANLQEKFNKLMLFYKEGCPKVGWNKYESINLAYDGQIVCTKKD